MQAHNTDLDLNQTVSFPSFLGPLSMHKIDAEFLFSSVRLGVDSDSNSQSQDCQWNQKLEKLNDEVRGLVLVVVRLFGRGVFSLGRNCGGIDLPNAVFIHHSPCSIAVADILKIIGCILSYRNP